MKSKKLLSITIITIISILSSIIIAGCGNKSSLYLINNENTANNISLNQAKK